MKRFFGRIDDKNDNQIIIDGNEFNHLKKVLRMNEGDKIIANVNDDYDYTCTISKMGKNDCICLIEEKLLCQALPKRNITLFQMLPKKDYFDNIIAKSIELGVNKIIPFTSQYTMIKDIKEERVASQVMTACKQCERSKLVDVTKPAKLKELPDMLKEYDLVIFAYENEETPFNPEILSKKQNIAVIVGNEAGFNEEEAKLLKQCSHSISLGKRILRCDTAVITTLALVSVLSNN